MTYYTQPIDRSVSQSVPATEPLTLDDAKKHLEIAVSDNYHDRHVAGLITAAREIWERDTQLCTTVRTVTEKWAEFPDGYTGYGNSYTRLSYYDSSGLPTWRLYYRPVSSITSITYYDTANVSQTLASSVYSFDPPNGQLLLAADQSWPSVYSRWDAISVVYSAGHTTPPEYANAAIKLQIDLLFELRGMTKDKNAVEKAYHCMVERYARNTYP